MTTSKASLAALAFLTLHLPGQVQEAEPEVVLSITTTMHEFVWQVHNLLPVEVDPDLPDVEDSDQLHLVFTSDGKLKLEAGKPGPNVLVLHARHRALKKVLKDEAGVLFRFVRALAFFHFVSGMKAEPRYVARAMKAVTEFPNQIEKLDVVVTKRRDFPNRRPDRRPGTCGSWGSRSLSTSAAPSSACKPSPGEAPHHIEILFLEGQRIERAGSGPELCSRL